MKTIDINCDMGESFGNFTIGNDEAIFPYITSCNIACGVHAGDPLHIKMTIEKALKHGVQIGAHPGYPDLQGFGRRVLPMTHDELTATMLYQVSALKGMVESLGGKLTYVKPHGALYNEIARNKEAATTVVSAIKSVHPTLAIVGLAGSHMKSIVETEGMTFIPEAFADRRYESNGQLMSRAKEEAVLHSSEEAAKQVISILKEGYTSTKTGEKVNIEAQSFCIHGDNPKAVELLKAIDEALKANQFEKKAFATQ
uniref:5-oxoprolinase subunit PxpA n=1 Tax=Roseivirga sp. TaxID=1964215 RepID=UPI004047CDE3